MMSIRRRHHLPLFCVLLVSLLFSPASFPGYVWCVSADGQATLEKALAGDCGLDSPASRADDCPALALTAATDDCGPCHDISPAPQWGSTRSRDNGSFGTPAAPVAANVVAALNPPAPPLLISGPFPEYPPRTSEPILQHRTVVLLI